METEAIAYADLPAYRKFAVYFILLLVLTPLALLVALTGDVYKNQDGTAVKQERTVMIIVPITFLILSLSRLL